MWDGSLLNAGFAMSTPARVNNPAGKVRNTKSATLSRMDRCSRAQSRSLEWMRCGEKKRRKPRNYKWMEIPSPRTKTYRHQYAELQQVNHLRRELLHAQLNLRPTDLNLKGQGIDISRHNVGVASALPPSELPSGDCQFEHRY